MFQWISLLLPPFMKLVEALCEDCEDKEREAMIELNLAVARVKAIKKFGPRP